MDDKKKLDEGISLTTGVAADDGVDSKITFYAEDSVALAQVLKLSGVQSADFDGPAVLVSQMGDEANGIIATVTAPSMRDIMHLLEPQFKAVGDLTDIANSEASEVDEDSDSGELAVLLDQIAQQNLEGEVDGIVSGVIGSNNVEIHWIEMPYLMSTDLKAHAYELQDKMIANAGIRFTFDDGMHADSERLVRFSYIVVDKGSITEAEAEPGRYDYRENPVNPTEYPGPASKTPVQPKVKYVPAKSGDNPIAENDDTDDSISANSLKEAFAALKATMLGELEEPVTEALGDLADQARRARDASKGGFVQHVNMNPDGSHYVDDWFDHETTVVSYSNGRFIGGEDPLNGEGEEDYSNNEPVDFSADEIDSLEFELEETKGSDNQYGKPYYMNTDLGFASMNDIIAGHPHFPDMDSGSNKIGVTLLAIDRNGKLGYNFINGIDSQASPGTKVTIITPTRTGVKRRPGINEYWFTAADVREDPQWIADKLERFGISMSKKLPVKTFD